MAWNYTDNEYLKLYRKFVGWEWYQDVNTKVLFLHCLLRANWKAGSWMGIHYEAGQFVTSLSSLASETGLTVKQVRTALKHLKGSGEVADLRQANFRIITVKNWNRYQTEGKPTGKPGANQGQTLGNRYKKVRSIEDKKYVTPTHTAPTFSEVQEFCFANGYQNVDVAKFMEYNEAAGWKMDWKKAVELWWKKDKERGSKRNNFGNIIEHDYDVDALEAALIGGGNGQA